jgi:hypothetical protein
MRNKYGNRKVFADGMEFDSVREYRRYVELKLLQAAGVISNLRCQVPYELIPAQYETIRNYSKTGKRLKDKQKCIERAVEYIADFVYTDTDGCEIVEDAKGGKRTKDYIIKRKLMRYIHGITIQEV